MSEPTVGGRPFPKVPSESEASHMARAIAAAIKPGGPTGRPSFEWETPEILLVHYAGAERPAVSFRISVEVVA